MSKLADKYILHVTGGPSYDPCTHKTVPVNSSTPFHVSNDLCEVNINLRIQNYRGLPRGCATTSSYFSHPSHTKDQYSISFTFVPKKSINGNKLLFGNDFDHPIRDHLPPGFGKAFQIVKWFIDPGIDGDVYADEPYLYGPALSSINALRIGSKVDSLPAETVGGETEKGSHFDVVEEGADSNAEDAKRARQETHMPPDSAARKKFFLNEEHRKGMTFEQDRAYHVDFFNPYLDFNEFALKLPGFTLPIIKYWDGQPLRYVLKNKETGEPYFVLVFTLVIKEEYEKRETEKSGGKDTVEGKAEGEQSEKEPFEPGEDDVD